MFRFGDPGGRGYNAVGTSQVNLLAWWNGSNTTPANFSITSSGGRNGGNSLHFSIAGAGYISKTLDAQATWGIAFAIKVSAFPSGGAIFQLIDAGTTQIELRLNTNGTLKVTKNNGTALGTTTTAIAVSTWTHVEWLTTINNSTGTTQIWINGVSALNLTSQNTRNTANNSADQVILGSFVNNSTGTTTVDLDDIIVYDGQSNDAQGNPDIHSQIGDCSLTWLLPTGAGTNTAWTASSGSNYACTNEATPDGDTSYVSSSTTNQIDTYATADLGAGVNTVKSVMLMHYSRKDDSGSRSIAGAIRTNSANFVGNTISLGNSYAYTVAGAWGQNPSGTPAAWTPADVNNIEIGAKEIS
jgi:hypothetical protein